MQERRNPFLLCPVLEQQSLHGLAPSATISIRSEERLMSLWSRCATKAQCMSLDFTQATFAATAMRKLLTHQRKARQLCYQFALLISTIKQTFVYSCSLPLYWQTFCIHDRGFTFIKEYGILMTCIMFMTLWNRKDKRVWYKNCGNYSYCVMGRGIYAKSLCSGIHLFLSIYQD